ncbi:aldolase [Paenibacillus roseipurpureus]|uniref:Aldolase n=1 Tax=Paenibacillus roseopurpureus TaxID=2918901 RepID=A0AA96LMN9_9BACL|nr:aldolase [Paenibacillus sp. MBLB1832]WNR43814.1 aldolase [Paenibacillus sp. MBLB1832]
MIKTQERVKFQAFGLKIVSDIHLPELLPASDIHDEEEVIITFGDLTEQWAEQVAPHQTICITEDRVMFRVADTAIYAIQDGKYITVSPVKEAEESKIRLYLLGTCMGIILLQKRILPLHGSAIAINGKAYAFVGHSGAGKSTLASAFINQGYSLLSDDVIPVSFSSASIPFVTPSYPQQKLWQESLSHFGMDASQFSPIYQRETKYTVPVVSSFSSEPIPLAAVFELVKSTGDGVNLRPIPHLEGLYRLYNHTYRQSLLGKLGLVDWHFKTSAKLSEYVKIFQLERPVNGFTAGQLVSLVLDTIQKGES